MFVWSPKSAPSALTSLNNDSTLLSSVSLTLFGTTGKCRPKASIVQGQGLLELRELLRANATCLCQSTLFACFRLDVQRVHQLTSWVPRCAQ